MTKRNRIDVIALKAGSDLVAVARRYTALRKISRTGEYAGPCPRCGGTDRFHVKDQRFYCRQCYPRGGDVIDLIMLVEDISFQDACRVLTDNPAIFARQEQTAISPSEQLESSKYWMDKRFQTSAQRTIWATHSLLCNEQGRTGQDYLRKRGLLLETWQTYQLGYGQTFHPVRREQQQAIFMPWFTADGKRITAIQHRFISPTLAKHERYSLKAGSSPLIFGLHALAPAEILVIVEGEFNCMAIHQVGWQAISIGSESNRTIGHRIEMLSDALLHYDHIIIWFDQPVYGDDFAMGVSGAASIRTSISVMEQTESDANDLLITGALSDLLETLRGQV